MYHAGKIAALRQLGLLKTGGTPHADAILDSLDQAGINRLVQSTLGGMFGGAAIGGGLGAAYGNEDTTGFGRTTRGLLGGAVGGLAGTIGGAGHGLSRAMGGKGLQLAAPIAQRGAIGGAALGGAVGLMGSDRENMLKNTLIGAAGGGLAGGATLGGVEAMVHARPDLFRDAVEQAQRAAQEAENAG